MKREPKYVTETLTWCNARRREKGKRPLKRLPKGVQTDPHGCPCGEATGLWVGTRYWEDKEQGHRQMRLPRAVQRFVDAFDNGRLPQYIKGRRS